MNSEKKSGLTVLIIVVAVTALLVIMNIADGIAAKKSGSSKTAISKTFSKAYRKDGYIAKLYIEGVIQQENRTYNQKWLLDTINELKEDEDNKAIAIFIDSPGGTVYESDEAYLALEDYKTTGKKIYVYQAHMAASGAYYISCAANKIYANRNTLTGSIGVIFGSSMDATQLMDSIGIKYKTFHSGRNKNMLNMNEPLTEEQEKIMLSISDETYSQFTGIVAKSRNFSDERVRKIADGRIYSAKQALENGLIDKIDSWDNMIKDMCNEYFEEKEIPVIDYKYEADFSFTDFLFGKSGNLRQAANKLSDIAAENEMIYPAYLWK